MTGLPRGWAHAALDELFDHRSGNSKIIKGRQATEPGMGLVPAFSASGQDIWTTEAEHTGGGLVISAVGARCGKVFRAAAPTWTAVANTHVLKPKSSNLNVDFWWYLVNDEDWWIRSGSAQPFVKVKDSLQRSVPVPPLAEQERIVAAIEEAFSKLDAGEVGLRTVRRLLKRMRDAILAAAVTGRLVPQDPTDTPASKLLADLGVEPMEVPDGQGCPDGWAWATVETVGRVDLGRQRHPDWHDGPNMKPYLRVANVFEDRIDASDLKQMHFEPEAFERFRLQPGDVLLNEGQTPELLGRPAIYRGDPPDVAFTNSILRFRSSPAVTADWALLVFRQCMRSGRFTRESRITTNIAHLSASRLKPIEFPVPPREAQLRIVAEVDRQLSGLQACERAVDVGLGQSAALRRSVLKAAFEGKLVPQDPSDEPASVLLDRIRLERAAAPKTKSRRARAKS